MNLTDGHQLSLERYVAENNVRLVQDTTIRMFDGSCLYDLAGQNRHYRNHIIGNGWEYLEVDFTTRPRRRFMRGRKTSARYSVMSVGLPRRLPNVVFDSLKHQRRQFRLLFDPKQYMQLEGNFDKYFATYFGNGYTIDDLSFITPEVMEALIAADEYDIEIVHDHLMLFGPVERDAAAQLDNMAAALQLIRNKLLHNILTYRDERVPYDQGRRIVARAGMFLGGHQVSSLAIALYIAWFFVRLIFVLIVLLLILQVLRHIAGLG